MIYSMTGYAVAARELESAVLNLELRSVNHRYLDIQFRHARRAARIEPALREVLAARLNRGKVECRISYAPTPGRKGVELDAGAAAAARRAERARARRAARRARASRSRTCCAGPACWAPTRSTSTSCARVCRELLDAVLEEFTVSRGARRREAEGDAARARRGDRDAHRRSRAAHAAGDRRLPGEARGAAEGGARQRATTSASGRKSRSSRTRSTSTRS